MTRGNIQKLPKWKASPAWRASGAAENLRYVRKIAVDAQLSASDLPSTACKICQGPRRLMAANASLMVVGSAARLHTCSSSDWEHLCDLIYIVGLGLPVVVASTWRIAAGCPCRLVAHASGITWHASAAIRKPCNFILDKALVAAHEELIHALGYCQKQPKSKWTVELDKGQPLAANGVRASSIRELATAVLKLKTFHEDSCRRGYALSRA